MKHSDSRCDDGQVPAATLDDLAQEIFLRWNRDSDAAGLNDPCGYLHDLTHRVLNDWRDQGRIQRTDPERTAEEGARRIDMMLGSLSNQQREALLMHSNDGLTCVQIAQRQKLPYQVVLRSLSQAYSQIRMNIDMNIDDVATVLRL